jgi:hypothetical protein
MNPPLPDTIYPTHLASTGRSPIPLPISMVKCDDCTNVFFVLCLTPGNAPSCCPYCASVGQIQPMAKPQTPTFPNPPDSLYEQG